MALADLKKLQKEWEVAEKRESEFKPIPDGKYLAIIKEGVFEYSKNNRPQIVWSFEIADGKYKGRKLKKFDGLETKENIEWLKGTMFVLGITIPKKITNLPKALDKFFSENKKVCVDINIVTKGEYANVFVNNLSTLSTDDEDDDFGSTIDDDDDDEF